MPGLFPNRSIVYPAYNTQPIEISDRSMLYSLEPQGLRTALVESLTSYIQRLAHAHCVQPGILITKMCIPLLERNSNETPSMSFGSRASRAFNGTGSIVLRTANIIQTLTARSDLASLTLLPFAQAIPSVGIFRLVEAWCPICLSEWRDANREIYTPLLWTFTDIKVCLRTHAFYTRSASIAVSLGTYLGGVHALVAARDVPNG